MGLFDKNKNQPKFGPPIYLDMRIPDEQFPAEVRALLEGQVWFMGFPEKLSAWTIETLGMENDEEQQLVTIDTPNDQIPNGKSIRPVFIQQELLDALTSGRDPLQLVYKTEMWKRTGCSLEDESKLSLLVHYMNLIEVKEKDFAALIVPDYTGKSGVPGHQFFWYAILYPTNPTWDIGDLPYTVLGRSAIFGLPEYGGYELAAANALELFNSGKAIPGLIRVKLVEEGFSFHYYMPEQIVDAVGWWVEDDEGIPTTIPASN